jgi:prepilin-type N-terminal cleavage/methylation domain-containing protein
MKKGPQILQAFALVELLVVIAIIGILAALILPVVSRAKNQASKVTDLNNLKQVMLAVHSYATDANDVLPPPNWDQGGPTGTNSGWLYTPDLTASGSDCRDKLLSKVLANIEAQTGLLFSQEKRKVKVWFMSEQK